MAARSASAAKKTRPTASSAQAAGERAAGTPGTRLGSSPPARLTATIVTTATQTDPEDPGIERGVVKTARPESESTAAPTGNVRAPVIATTPFIPTSTPGVTDPVDCEQRRHDREPARHDDGTRVRARAPIVVSASAARAATSAVTPTP